jgi:hypothetical protein
MFSTVKGKAGKSPSISPIKGRTPGTSPLLFEKCNKLISNGKEIKDDKDFISICKQLKTYSVEDFHNLIVKLHFGIGRCARAKYNYLLSHVMNECFNKKDQLENEIKTNHKDIEPLNILENFSDHDSTIKTLTLESSKEFNSNYLEDIKKCNKLKYLENRARSNKLYRHNAS